MMAILTNMEKFCFKGQVIHMMIVWYLDTSARNYMIVNKFFFQKNDENHKGKVRFDDGSTIRYEGKGDILVIFKNNEEMVITNVLYLLDLGTNILSLRALDDQGCRTLLIGGVLTIHDKFGKFLTKSHADEGLYIIANDDGKFL